MATSRVVSSLTILFTLLIWGARAEATVNNEYSGWSCRPTTNGDANIWYDTQTGGISNIGDSASEVLCEIRKYTSYPATPANTNDKITSVVIDINNGPGSTGIDCKVQVYSSYIPGSGSNVTSDVQAHTSATTDSTITLSGFTTTNWWGSGSSWYYAQLTCTLYPGQQVYDYTVTEQGADNHYHIYPAFSLCSPADWTSAVANLYTGGNSSSPSGFLQAPGGASEFFYSCYLPGDEAQFSITPSDNLNEGWQWSYSYYGSSYGSPCSNNGGGTLCSYPSTCWSNSTSCIEPGSAYNGTNWPSKIFPGVSTDLPAPYNYFTHFLSSTTYYYAYFWQIIGSSGFANGDMEIVSVRTSGDYY